MVLAEFLNTNLLEPLKQRLRDEGYAERVAQCRAEAIAMVRSQLRKNGIDPDAFFPADAPEAVSEQQDDASLS